MQGGLQLVRLEHVMGLALLGGRLGHIVAVEAGQESVIAHGRPKGMPLKLYLDGVIEDLGGEDVAVAVDVPGLTAQVFGPLVGVAGRFLHELADIVLASGHFAEDHHDPLGNALREIGGIGLILPGQPQSEQSPSLSLDLFSSLLHIAVPGIQREDVHIQAQLELLLLTVFDLQGGHIAELGVGEQEALVLLEVKQAILLGVLENRQQSVVILTGHQHVHVIVPRNEALVTDGSEEGTVRDKVTDVILLAEIVEGLEDLQLNFLDLGKG